VGYLGDLSPNRADSLIWGLAELFPALVRPDPVKKQKEPELDDFGRPVGVGAPLHHSSGWMV